MAFPIAFFNQSAWALHHIGPREYLPVSLVYVSPVARKKNVIKNDQVTLRGDSVQPAKPRKLGILNYKMT